MRRFILVLTTLLLVIGNDLASGVSVKDEDIISLYDTNDSVIELTDANFTTNVYDPNVAWIVEFYAHWCGHCQRFSPTWKSLAKEFDVPGWKDKVRLGAINCAQQEVCGNYSISGTPTIRLFFGGAGLAGQGYDIMATIEVADMRSQVLKNIEMAQSYGHLLSPDLPSLLLTSGPQKIPQGKNMVAYIAEESNSGFLGRDVVFLASKQFPNVETRRIDWLYARNAIYNFQPLQMPAILVIPIEQNTLNWNKMRVHQQRPVNPTLENYRNEMLTFLATVANEYAGIQTTTLPPPTSTLGTTTTTTASATAVTILPLEDHNITDIVYMGDLERAIRYIVTTEVPSHESLDQLKLNTVYQMLESLARYLPLRKPLKDFLVALRDWPIRMEFKAVSGLHFESKVNELMEVYKPFDLTPSQYVGCQGSKPHLRGYPCSLWTLFHTLLVNASIKGDPSMALGGASTIAKAMVNYIYYFFSCRHCANNFSNKVNALGFLPSTPQDSILWLWQIHNMANMLLKGDPTEDPEHPKMLWPSAENCPSCRTDRLDLFNVDPTIALVQGQLWNVTSLVEYQLQVYRGESLRPVALTTDDDGKSEAFAALVTTIQSTPFTSENRTKLMLTIKTFCEKFP